MENVLSHEEYTGKELHKLDLLLARNQILQS